MRAVVQCVGSLVFFMSMAAQKLDRLDGVVANAVSLHPRVPAWSYLKIHVVPGLLERLLSMPYMSPRFFKAPRLTLPWSLSKIADAFHWECDSQSCHMMSLMWGTGWPACFEHENISEVTHHRLDDIYGGTSFNFYRHIAKMLREKKAVKYKKEERFLNLPDNYAEAYVKSEAAKIPVLLIRGKNNKVFSDSNKVSYDFLKDSAANVSYKEFSSYGHMDIFMGTNCHKDVFPNITEFFKQKVDVVEL